MAAVAKPNFICNLGRTSCAVMCQAAQIKLEKRKVDRKTLFSVAVSYTALGAGFWANVVKTRL